MIKYSRLNIVEIQLRKDFFMNENTKNLLEYLREIYKLKTKVVTDYIKYDKTIDLAEFKRSFQRVTTVTDFTKNLSLENETFILKYIMKEKEYPSIPICLEPYVVIHQSKVIWKKDLKNTDKNTSKVTETTEDIEEIEQTTNVSQYSSNESDEIPEDRKLLFEAFKKEYEAIRKENVLIQKYNALYEYFYNIYKRKEEFEEKIEVVLGKGLFVYQMESVNEKQSVDLTSVTLKDDLLSDSQQHDSFKIKRHVLEFPLKIEVDLETNTIYLKLDRMEKCNLASNFLSAIQGFKIKEQDALFALKDKIESDYENEEIFNFEQIYKTYLNDIAFQYEYRREDLEESEVLESGKCYIFERDSIIVRKKQPTIWLDDLNRIVTQIETKGEFCSENKLLYLVLETDEVRMNELLNVPAEDSRVLFPLPSNEEQYKVVEQTEHSNLVLVQGPPGTGKSHTIANLISNYVARGKRVLVTSEKSKALEVIREKLPEEIRNLSMTILNDHQNDNDLSNSIQIVLDKYKDKEYLEEYLKRIEKLEQNLSKNEQEKNENQQKILDTLMSSTKDYKQELTPIISIPFERYLLMDFAKYLKEHVEQDWIEDINPSSISFDKDFLLELKPLLKDLKIYQEILLNRDERLPKQENLNLNAYEENLINLKELEQEEVIENFRRIGLDERSLTTYDLSNLEKKLKQIIQLEQFYEREYIKENCTYLPRMKNVEMILKECEENQNFFEDTETLLIGNVIEYDENQKTILYEALQKVNQKLSNDGKISLLEKVQIMKELDLLTMIEINGMSLKEKTIDAKNMRMALEKLQYDIKIEKIKKNMESVLGASAVWEKIKESEFSRHIGKIKELLTTFMKYDSYVTEVTDALKDIFDGNALIQNLTVQENYIELDTILKNVISYEKYVEAKKFYEHQLEALEMQTAKDFKLFEVLLESIKLKDINKYKEEKLKIERVYEVEKDFEVLKQKYQKEVEVFPKFLDRYIDLEEEKQTEILQEFEKIIDYYKLKMFFLEKEKQNQKFHKLLEKKSELQVQEKKLIVDLIAEKSWYNQINHMNNLTCRALSEWLTLKTKLGKGTGKKANLIRKEMQEQMQIAKEAIPIWVMPVEKVVEQYPFEEVPQFDVIIMDESSQSSIVSITALLRGRKVIIVGDDKQISPIAIGITVEDLKALQNRYLKETCLGVGFDMETSLYDLAQNVCGSKKVVLKEHFRCLPEIIEFSNIHFYGNQINCLKVRGKENTIPKPIRTEYVPEGKVRRVSGSLVNQKEIEKVIALLKEIEMDRDYQKKTIGIIVLQNSSTHINLITSEIWKNFNNDFMKERRIKVGTTYDFQGDERDVIILSMVVSHEQENGETNRLVAFTKKEYERSFNVAASRAKEQVILVHSVLPEELSTECLRYKLITYYTTYQGEKEAVQEQKMVSQFEKDFYQAMKTKGLMLIPQFEVGKYVIDFVLENDDGKKVALECDGDQDYTLEDYEKEMLKQDVLERCGWTFLRIRASEFYYDQEKVIKGILKKIKEV